MHRARFRLLLCCFLGGMFAHAADPDDFRGVWLGKIVAPNAQAELGLAFVSSQDGMLVSVNFPERFLHRVNFGVADIRGDTFALAPLHLRVSRSGDVLSGTFGPARLPVELRRGGTFAPEPPVSDLPPGPAPVWTRSLGAAIWASPVAFEGVLYVGATDGKFHAVRASDGHPLWTWSGSHALYGEALATADRIYFVDERTQLICLDRSDGALVWRTPLHDEALAGGPPPANETFNHRTATPVADARGTLYVGSTDRGLYAIRAASGKILWRHDVKARVYAPVALRGDDVIVPCFDGSVVTINRRTRRELSRSQLGGALVSAPVVTPDRVVLGSRDYMLYALDRGGAVAWRNSFWFSWIESTPRFAGGTL
ncbi:MAG TPA: PQQ-binding-like beta-propeller repeat protein, partial [Opitutus sp.]|nr:PQQ-binding-like beta-propeller repeat protein [Opitutus sp.]